MRGALERFSSPPPPKGGLQPLLVFGRGFSCLAMCVRALGDTLDRVLRSSTAGGACGHVTEERFGLTLLLCSLVPCSVRVCIQRLHPKGQKPVDWPQLGLPSFSLFNSKVLLFPEETFVGVG